MRPRVRFAPSPTGQLHVGNARTALYNWLFARRHGGAFVLRIEDTDTGRQQGGAEEAIYEDLSWLGLGWDEGPVPYADPGQDPPEEQRAAARFPAPAPAHLGPYRQSERGAPYGTAFEKLRSMGALYACFCSEALLEEDRGRALAEGRTPGYSGRCSAHDPAWAASRVEAGEPVVLRFRVGHYGVVHDLVRGEVDFRSRQAFDPVVRRRDGRPTYNFAVVVDDAAMAITHVIRGEDHLTNTALQLRLYEALGLPPPQFAHLSLLLGPDGTPLSKRHGATSVGEFRRRGYPPEALVNSLALLGWTPPGDRVLLARDEMVGLFDLSRVHATPAIFDGAKLDWISGQVIRSMSRSVRGRRIGESLREAGLWNVPPDRPEQEAVAEWLADLGDLLATSLDRFDQVPERVRFLFEFDPGSVSAHRALEEEGARFVLETFARSFEAAAEIGPETVRQILEGAKKATGLAGRPLLHPLRAALTGRESGPEIARLLALTEQADRLGLTPGVPGVSGRIRLVLAGASGDASRARGGSES